MIGDDEESWDEMEEEKSALEVYIEKTRNVPNSIKNGKSREAEFERNS
jgi:hypothetical protein